MIRAVTEGIGDTLIEKFYPKIMFLCYTTQLIHGESLITLQCVCGLGVQARGVCWHVFLDIFLRIPDNAFWGVLGLSKSGVHIPENHTNSSVHYTVVGKSFQTPSVFPMNPIVNDRVMQN